VTNEYIPGLQGTIDTTSSAPLHEMPDVADDLMIGDVAIAKFFGKTRWQIQWMLRNRRLPMAFKLGDRWCVRKSSVRRYLETRERAAEAAAALTIEETTAA
jgi:hypothetical protein